MIVALVAALFGPLFVDWNAYRSTFETYAERTLGHRVTVLGRADARLLPTPTLIFSDVRVGEAEDPLMVVSSFEARIELAPLLNGEIRVVDMRLDEPELHLSLDESGRIDWLTAATAHDRSQIDPSAVELSSVDIRSGRIEVIDARTATTYAASDINLNVSARSLEGPYKAEGSASFNGMRHSLRIATGRADLDGKMRVKAEIVPTDVPVTLQMDGLLGEEDDAPRYSGDFVLASVATVEASANGAGNGSDGAGGGQMLRRPSRLWQSEGKFELDPTQLDVGSFVFRYGREERPFRLEGATRIFFGDEPRFETQVSAKQVDLDRIFGEGPQDPVSIDRAAAALVGTLKTLPMPPIPGKLELKLPGLVAGGGIIQDIRLDAETLPRGWRISRLDAQLPGRSAFEASGELSLGEAPGFEGKVHLASSQPSAFAGWWRKGLPAKPLTLDRFAVDTRVEISQSALNMTGLKGTVGDSGFVGAMTWRMLPSGDRAVVTADLDADRLDLDQLQTVLDVFRERRDAQAEAGADVTDASTPWNTDVSVRMAVEDLRLSGTKVDNVELIASYTDDAVNVERLFAADFAGARIEAQGQVTSVTRAPDGRFEATLEAQQLGGVRDVLTRLFPDAAIVRHFAKSADALGPAKLNAAFSARAGNGGASKATLTVNGQFGGSTLDARAGFTGRVDQWRKADLDIEAHVKAADGVELLRQAAFDVLPLQGMGPASVDITASGIIGSGLDVQLAARGIASEFDSNARLGFPAGKPMVFGGELVLRSDDITPFSLMSGRVLPVMAGEAAFRASARVDGDGLAVTLSKIDAQIDDARIGGTLKGDLAAAHPQWTGNIRTTAVNAGLLSELVLGADAWSSVNGDAGHAAAGKGAGQSGGEFGSGSSFATSVGGWPSGAFGTPYLRDSSLNLEVSADRVDLGLARQAEQARFSLQASGTELAIDGFDAAFEGGRLTGSLLIKRSNGEAAATGNMRASGVDLEALVWRRNNRPVARGRMDLSINFEGAGRSVSGIVASIAGGGTFQVSDGELRGINTAAFGSVIHAVDAGLALEDADIRKVFLSHLDAGSLPFKSLDGSLTLVSGTARARNVTVDTESATAFGTAFIDLDRWEVESDWSLKVDPGDNAVTGAEPQVGLVFRGPLDAPSRTIDIAPLTAFLTLRTFEQEVRRVEKLQADIQERERFLRELKLQRQQRIRREREQSAADAEEKAEAQAATEAKAEAAAEAKEKAEAEAKAAADAKAAAEALKASEPTPQRAGDASAAQPLSGDVTESIGAIDALLEVEDFARRIRPAIEESAFPPLVLPRATSTPIQLEPSSSAALEGLLEPLSSADAGTLEVVEPTPPPVVPARTRPRRHKVPRYISGPGNRVIPNPAYQSD